MIAVFTATHPKFRYGGGLFAYRYSTVTARRCRWYRNHAEIRGGAIVVMLAKVYLVDCEIEDFSADFGGAVQTFLEAQFFAYNTKFLSGHADTLGGALHAGDFSEADLFNCTFFNLTSRADGGALGATTASEIRVHGGRLVGNTAADDGGVASAVAGSTVEIHDAVVEDNQAGNGGVVAANNAVVHLVRVQAARNTAVGSGEDDGSGGLLRLQGSEASGTLTNSTVDACTAVIQGGAVAASDDVAALTIDGTAFHANEAGRFGGAVFVDGSTQAEIRACSFEDSRVKYAPEPLCMTLTMEDTGGNGWDGSLLRIYAEDDYVGDEVYDCPKSCSDGEVGPGNIQITPTCVSTTSPPHQHSSTPVTS